MNDPLDASQASIPGDRHDVANASRRDLLRAALFDTSAVERRVGRFIGRRQSWKKAIVTLHSEDSIDLYGEEG